MRIVLILSALYVCAPVRAQYSGSCENYADSLGYPDYYCDCGRAARYHYGMDTIINDVTWFSGTFGDIRRGMTCYWFSEGAVKGEIFLFCTLPEANMTYWISKNRAYELDMSGLNDMLAEFNASGALDNIEFKMRCTPQSGRSGRVISTPYDEGPGSTCLKPLPLVWGMPYVVSSSEVLYLTAPEVVPDKVGVRWVQKMKNNRDSEVDVFVLRGSCDGDTLAAKHLTDSTRIWLWDSINEPAIMEAMAGGEMLYVHARSQGVGRLSFLSPLVIRSHESEETYCQGLEREIGDISYMADTVVMDSLYSSEDTCLHVTRYTLTFTPPTLENDSVALYVDELGKLYQGYRAYPITAYGVMDSLLLEKKGECTRLVRLKVGKKWRTTTDRQSLSTCYGKSLRVADKVYYRDTTLIVRDTLALVTAYPQEPSTVRTTTYTLRFTAPEVVHDTIVCPNDSLGFEYQYDPYDDTRFEVIDSAGTYEWEVEDDCIYIQELHVDVYCRVGDVVMSDTVWVRQDSLPIVYKGDSIDEFGSYTLYISHAGACEEWQLVVMEDSINEAVMEVDAVRAAARKIWVNNHVLIIRNDERYTLLGLKEDE